MKKAIIYGINGMDGRTLAFILLNKGYEVIGTTRRNTLNLRDDIHSLYDYNENLKFEYCNIHDNESVRQLLLKHNNTKEQYLLAAQSHVGFSFNSPEVSVRDGVGVYNVLENTKNINPSCLTYYAATSELFGGAKQEKYNENSEFDCHSPYSVAKEHGTRWVKYYRQLGLFACYGILFNHSNCFRGKDFFIRRVTNTAARISLGLESELKLGNLNFYRDEHWSDFGCEMMWKMLQNKVPIDYVIANGTTYHGEQFLDEAFGYFNLNWKKFVKIDKTRFRPNEVVKLIGDSTKAQKELGWIPNRISFKEHISMMCKFDYDLESGKKPVIPKVL